MKRVVDNDFPERSRTKGYCEIEIEICEYYKTVYVTSQNTKY